MDNWLWTWNHHMQTAIERNLLCFWWNLFIFIFLYMAVLFAFGSMFCIWLNFFVFWCISSLSDLQTSMGGASPYALSSVDGGGSQSLLSLVSLYLAFDFFCILCLISCVFCVWFLVYFVKHVIRADPTINFKTYFGEQKRSQKIIKTSRLCILCIWP